MAAERSIAVLGAGAVGCYLAAHLANSSTNRVTLIGRSKLVDAVRSAGVRVQGRGERLTVWPDAVVDPTGLPAQDLVILGVRADDVEGALESAVRLTGDVGLLLAVQNGVGTEEILARAIGAERVIAGALTTSVVMDEPGIVTMTSQNGGMGLASLDGSAVPGWVAGFIDDAGVTTALFDDYRELRWSKLLLNMLFAATSAILDMKLAAIVGDVHVFRLEQLAFREAVRVMNRLRIRTVDLPGYKVRLACLAMRLPRSLAWRILGPRMVAARGGRSPGMRWEMHRGRSEVGWFNGAVARAGAVARVPTPVNAALTELTLELASHADRRDAFRQRPEALIAWMRARGIRI
jgi:2-dehydropantoate 2-reductase